MARGARIMLVAGAAARLRAAAARSRRFEAARAEVDALLLAEIARRRASRRARRRTCSRCCSGACEAASRRRTRAARPPDHAAARRPRDDGDAARVDVRAPRAPSGGARARRLRATRPYIDAVSRSPSASRPVAHLRDAHAAGADDGRRLTMPAGATLGTSITLMHRRADLYPDPLAFRPERFLERQARDLRVDAVRRRRAALPRRRVRVFEMRQVLAWCSRRAARARPTRAPSATRRRGITFVPRRGALRRPLSRCRAPRSGRRTSR